MTETTLNLKTETEFFRGNVFEKDVSKGICREKTVVALGMFDGVHIGHKALINSAARSGQIRGLEPVVFTFSNSPKGFFGKQVKRLCSNEERARLLYASGIERIVEIPFNDAIRSSSPEDFLKMLIKAVSPQIIIAGFNYTFGKDRRGSAESLKIMAAERGIEAYIIPPVVIGGETVSSTRIKACLKAGEIEDANIRLGRTFSLTGKIRAGKKLGRELDFPTANITPDPEIILPSEGVYITNAEISGIDGICYPAVTNIGASPTFGETGLNIETNIIGFDGDIYGKELTVGFIKRLRPVMKFDSPAALRAQLIKDAARAKEYFAGIQT